jgi:hypothetical protein
MKFEKVPLRYLPSLAWKYKFFVIDSCILFFIFVFYKMS